jgi:hypothetical protein
LVHELEKQLIECELEKGKLAEECAVMAENFATEDGYEIAWKIRHQLGRIQSDTMPQQLAKGPR